MAIYEGFRALDLFTDRHEIIHHFATRLHERTDNRILLYRGDGGNGKSLLLRYLKTNCCKVLPPEDWQLARTLTGQSFVEFFNNAPKATPIPVIDHDFAIAGMQVPHIALFELRRRLSGHNLRFPKFDYAAAVYLDKLKKPIRETFQLPAEEMDFINSMIDRLTESGKTAAIGKAILQSIGKYQKNSIDLWLKRRNLDEATIEQIQRMDPDRELLPILPQYLAEDLNTSLELDNAPPAIVLLFDTHEAFFGSGERGPHLSAEEERWFRVFLRNLNRKQVVTIVAGRDYPTHWTELARQQDGIPAKDLDSHLVGHLSEADSALFLERAGVPANLHAAITKFCSVQPGEAHPFYLGLAVDLIEAAAKAGESITPESFQTHDEDCTKTLLDRLLRYTGIEMRRAVEALSACRAFDREIYKHLAEPLDLPPPASFDRLIHFSFVWPAPGNRYRIHDLVRRLYREQKNPLQTQAHAKLESFYRQGDSIQAQAEALYHLSQQDPEKAMWQWIEALRESTDTSNHSSSRIFLDVRSEFPPASLHAMGAAWSWEGQHHLNLSNHNQARLSLRASADALKRATGQDPRNESAHGNLGLCQQRLGELEASLSQYQQATQSYLDAITSYGSAIALSPDDFCDHNNLGLCRQRLGELQASLSQWQEAKQSYSDAIASFGQALALAPNLVAARTNLGSCQQHLGDLEASLSQTQEAKASYSTAIASFGQALALAPNFVLVHNNFGACQHRLGDLEASLSQTKEAQASYSAAIASYGQALALAPNFVLAHNNLGGCQQSLGDLNASLGETQKAKASYSAAIASYGQALTLAPNLVMAHNNLGVCQQRLGDFEASLSQAQEAKASYFAAIAAYGQALTLAPNYVLAHNNLAFCQQRLGDLEASLSQTKEAQASYSAAISSYGQALILAPSFVQAHYNLGNCQIMLGDLQASVSQTQEAIASYSAAIASFGQALALAPNYVGAHNNLGICQVRSGNLKAKASKTQEAKASYSAAIASFQRVLEIAPKNPDAQDNIDECQAAIDRLH